MKVRLLNDGGYCFLSSLNYPIDTYTSYDKITPVFNYRGDLIHNVVTVDGFSLWEALRDEKVDDNIVEYVIDFDLDFIVNRECELILES